MIAIIAVLALIVIAFKIMFTQQEEGHPLRLLVWFALGVGALSIAWNTTISFSSGLPPLYQTLFLAVVITCGILLLLRLFISPATWWKLVAWLLRAALLYPIVLPLRLLWWGLRRLFLPRTQPRLERSNDLSRSWIERSPGSHSS